MVSLDEPAHARLRKPAARAFSARRVTAMIPAITRLALDAVAGQAQFDPSVPVWRRATARPVTIGGVNLPEGARLFLWLAAAGRDPSVFHQPDLFDPGRPNARQHLAFGLGLHYCLGASLGKMETRMAAEELASRYPRLRLADGQYLTFRPNISFRAPQQLRVQTAA